MSGFPRRRAVAVALIVFALVGLAASGSSLARSHVAASTAKHPVSSRDSHGKTRTSHRSCGRTNCSRR